MTDDNVLPYVRDRLPGFTPVGNVDQLLGGNLNIVWRVPCGERSVMVQLAPPYVVADPDVPLDPIR